MADMYEADGVCIITLTSWAEFHQEVSKIRSQKDFVWRGQRKEWSLLPSFDRPRGSVNPRYRDDLLRNHFETFKKEMDQLHPDVLPKKDDMDNSEWKLEVWALGQHYDLKTPLLDWTEDPYIAAYFAFEKGQMASDDDSRYVFALRKSLKRLLIKWKRGGKLISRERRVPFTFDLEHPSPRFKAQKGIFTNAWNGEDIETNVKSFNKKRPNKLMLVKFRIPSKDRDEFLKYLKTRGIDNDRIYLPLPPPNDDIRDVIDRCNKALESEITSTGLIFGSKHDAGYRRRI